MNRFFISLSALLLFSCYFLTAQVGHIESSLQSRLLKADNTPTQALLDLLEILNITHDGTLPSIVKVTQERLLFSDREDWQIPEDPTYDPKKIVPLLDTLGLCEKIIPQKMHYEGAIFLGGNLWSVRQRLAYVIELLNHGYTFNKMFIMTGEHPLDEGRYTASDFFEYQSKKLPLKSSWKPWHSFPKNEAEMICMVFEQVELPKKFYQLECKVIVSKIDPISGKRPTTRTNVVDFLKTKPVPGTYLVFSNQPYIGYQDSVWLTLLPGYITIETVGHEALQRPLISQCLDRLARWLYQENLRRNSNMHAKF